MNKYEILKINNDASTKEITKAYKLLCLEFHPDRNPEGYLKFIEITDAYKTLCDINLRKKYDIELNKNSIKKMLKIAIKKTYD